MNKTIEELNKSNNNSRTETKLEYINKIKSFTDLKFVTELTDENFINNNAGLLAGTFYCAKDNIWTKGIKTTASSKILENFIPAENATIVDLLEKAGATLLGKTVLDELGMAGTGLHAVTGNVYNPYDKTRISGGSSSGSVFATTNGIGNFTLGTDTGDSIRKPASLCGVVGFKPTYGSISRYGVIPYAPSLDHVGFLTNNVDDLFYLSEVTFKKDSKDFTSIDNSNNYVSYLNKKTTKKRVGYFSVLEKYIPAKLWIAYKNYFSKLKDNGYEVVAIDFNKDLLDAVAAIYMVISFSEAVSTSANLSGINFGLRIDGKDYVEIMKKTRSKGFGDLVKRRFIMGSYQLMRENQDDLILKAKKIRRLITNEMNKAYDKVDFLVMPPSTAKAKLIAECSNKTMEDDNLDADGKFLDNLLVLANFTGMPSITIPFVTEDKMPIGINLNANIKEDLDLLMFAKESNEIIADMEGKEL